MRGLPIALLRYLSPFLLGGAVAVAVVTDSTASVAALLAVAALWLLSVAARIAK